LGVYFIELVLDLRELELVEVSREHLRQRLLYRGTSFIRNTHPPRITIVP